MNEKHRISWWAIEPTTGERIRRNRHMPAGGWGWDATCSCGWDTRTGGAIHARVREAIEDHRWDIEQGYAEEGR